MTFIHNRGIKSNDIFRAADFPMMVNELAAIKKEIADEPGYFRADIIISYLKDHCIKNDWIKANPELTKIITSGTFTTGQLESVFQRCRNYKIFLDDFENYIRMQMQI